MTSIKTLIPRSSQRDKLARLAMLAAFEGPASLQAATCRIDARTMKEIRDVLEEEGIDWRAAQKKQRQYETALREEGRLARIAERIERGVP